MNKDYFEDELFEGKNYTATPFLKGEYDNCRFTNCVFTKTDLENIIFADCIFDHCDLSMAELKNTTFRDMQFKHCKLLGLRFDECNSFLLSFSFEDCVLNFSSFYKQKLKNTNFINCRLAETEFAEADLTNANFSNCDLQKAVFNRTILENADFRTSFNFSIHPETNKISKAKFSLHNITGLLDQYNISIE
ncbi:MAG: pentapeptide repeat-containing protein [Lacibacter sp.]